MVASGVRGSSRWSLGVMVLVLGAATAWAAGGGFDPTFGSGGVTVTPIAQIGGGVWDSAVQPDGRVVVVGDEWTGLRDANSSQIFQWAIRRYESTGALDTGFGTGGRVALFGTLSGSSVPFDVALDSAGRVVAAGRTRVQVTTTTGGKKPTTTTQTLSHAVVARLLPNGQLDSSFGNGGLVTLLVPNSFLSEAFAVAVLPGDKILIAGNTQFAAVRRNDPANGAIFLARYTAAGALDATFGTGGIALYDPSANAEYLSPKAMGLQSDGKIVLGTKVTTSPNGGALQPWVIVRYLSSGALDGAFGVKSETGRTLLRMTVGPSDEIVASGLAPHGGHTNDVVVERRLANGTLDSAFGAGGVAYAGLYDTNQGLTPAVQADGKILVNAQLFPPVGDPQGVVIRFLGDGSLDAGFGSGGYSQPVTLGFSVINNGTAFAPNGDIYMAGNGGTGGPGGQTYWFVARYLAN